LQFVDWHGLHQYHYLHQGSRISDFDIGRGDMMVKQKTKSASKQVAGVKAKASSAVPGTRKIATTAVSATAKRIAEKKAPSAAAANKSQTPSVKKVSASAAQSTTPANKATAQPSPEERYRMVETAAYFIAEQHGFQGRSDEHWAAAEREIAARLGAQ
jgi:hypothetical protein